MNYSVILAGGSGTRLWPASRRHRPKQFLPLAGAGSELLIQAVARRLDALTPNRVRLVTQADQVGLVRAALPDLGPDGVVAEPAGRNTAAAIGLACAFLLHKDPAAVAGFVPADQTVKDEGTFIETSRKAMAIAESNGCIVTLGIVPTRPDPGFGYIEIGKETAEGARKVKRFVEKPDRKTAEKYVESKSFLWNAGMFFAPVQVLFDEICKLMPETGVVLRRILAALATDEKSAAGVIEQVYKTVPSISIDYGVMEKTENILCLPGDFGWNDVGSWSAVSEYASHDKHGNASVGTSVSVKAHNNIVYSEDKLVVLVGVDNLVVVQAGDAILVIPRDQAESVRDAVDLLKQEKLDRYL